MQKTSPALMAGFAELTGWIPGMAVGAVNVACSIDVALVAESPAALRGQLSCGRLIHR
jgi:hypothetical protein